MGTLRFFQTDIRTPFVFSWEFFCVYYLVLVLNWFADSFHFRILTQGVSL